MLAEKKAKKVKVSVEMDSTVAQALYEQMLKPAKDDGGSTVYIVSLMLARELREVLFVSLNSWGGN